MIIKDLKFDFDDLLIVPAEISEINSRSDVNVYDENGMLPLITAPMDTVVGFENCEIFKNNKIYPVIPRTASGGGWIGPEDSYWVAIGLNQFENLSKDKFLSTDKQYLVVDIANGHMQKLMDLVKKSKDIHQDQLVLMVGNIANPQTYKLLSEVGADYVRVGVGNGCFTPKMSVKTNKGFVNIEDIALNDLIYSHTGELKPVINIITYDRNEEMLLINDIECTKNHEFYVVDIKYKDIINEENYIEYAEWISADQLDKDKHLLIEL